MKEYRALPNPASLIFALRSVGYNLLTAVADIVDNSISAEATKIDIKMLWNRGEPTVCILDNGRGMDGEKLLASLSIGGRSPEEEREEGDLGRFGLGLKTASFSQCRKLQVFSKTEESEVSGASWDLDFIREKKDWILLKEKFEEDFPYESGTAVFWKKIDKFPQKEEDFYLMIGEVELHLSQHFSEFLSKTDIEINGNKIRKWDPFLLQNQKTEILREEEIGGIRIQPYILPHDSQLTEEEKEMLKGSRGWSGHQGFYIYRNKRLIINGDWLRLFKGEEHYKLVRIRIDIDSTRDFSWDIDIKKSAVKIPHEIKKDLKRIATASRNLAIEKYRYRGKNLSRSIKMPAKFIWESNISRRNCSYKISRDNDFIKNFAENYRIEKKEMNKFLKIIEETLPVETIISNVEYHRENHHKPFSEDMELIKEMIAEFYGRMKCLSNKENIKRALLVMEPFSSYPEIIESTLEGLK